MQPGDPGLQLPALRCLEHGPGLDASDLAFDVVLQLHWYGRAAAQVIPEVYERGDREGEARSLAGAVSQLEHLCHFRVEVGPAGDDVRRRGREIEVAVDARRRAHRARGTHPPRLPGCRLECDTHARQVLPTGVVVALELQPRGDTPAGAERDLILQEHVAPAEIALLRQEQDDDTGHRIVARFAVPGAPHHGVPPRAEQVLQLDVVKIGARPEVQQVRAARVVVVGLQSQLRPRGQLAFPSREHVATGGLDPAGIESAHDRAPLRGTVVHVALQGQRIATCAPVGAESRRSAGTSGRPRRRRSRVAKHPSRDSCRRVAARRLRRAAGPGVHRRQLRSRPHPTDTALPRASAAARVITLMTPFTAFAPQRVAPGPVITSTRSMSCTGSAWSSQNTPEKSGV